MLQSCSIFGRRCEQLVLEAFIIWDSDLTGINLWSNLNSERLSHLPNGEISSTKLKVGLLHCDLFLQVTDRLGLGDIDRKRLAGYSKYPTKQLVITV